jgi:hypothetical protein
MTLSEQTSVTVSRDLVSFFKSHSEGQPLLAESINQLVTQFEKDNDLESSKVELAISLLLNQGMLKLDREMNFVVNTTLSDAE